MHLKQKIGSENIVDILSDRTRGKKIRRWSQPIRKYLWQKYNKPDIITTREIVNVVKKAHHSKK